MKGRKPTRTALSRAWSASPAAAQPQRRGLPQVVAWTQEPLGWYYRCELPLRALQRAGFVTYTLEREGSRSLASEPDILLIHRTDDVRVQAQVRRQQRALIVIDEDDDALNATVEEMDMPFNEEDGQPPMRPGENAFDYNERLSTWFVEEMWTARETLPRAILEEAFRVLLEQQSDAFHMRSGGKDRLQGMMSAITDCPTKAHAMAVVRKLSARAVYLDLVERAAILTVSTSALATIYGELKEQTCILPNCLDLQLPCYVPQQKAQREDIVIGWAGSSQHASDLRLCQDVLATVLRAYDGRDGRTRVVLMLGGTPEMLGEAFGDLPGAREFAEVLARRFPSDWMPTGDFKTVRSECGRYVYRSWTTGMDRAPAMYDDIDIGIVPNVLGTRINTSKSDLKGLEMAGMGVPCIASPIPSYVEWRGQPGTGCIVLPDNEPNSWLEALRRLIDDEALRRQMSYEALAFAQTRSIDVWAPRWMEVYREAARRKGLSWAA